MWRRGKAKMNLKGHTVWWLYKAKAASCYILGDSEILARCILLFPERGNVQGKEEVWLSYKRQNILTNLHLHKFNVMLLLHHNHTTYNIFTVAISKIQTVSPHASCCHSFTQADKTTHTDWHLKCTYTQTHSQRGPLQLPEQTTGAQVHSEQN